MKHKFSAGNVAQTTKLRIVRLKPHHINSAVKLITKSVGDKYEDANREVRNIFRKSCYRIYRFVDTYVIELDGKVIGYGGIWAAKHDPKRFCMLDWLAIEDSYRGRGLGTNLMNFLFERAKKRKIRYVYVETSSDNKSAVKFYKKCGFRKLCTIPEYYDTGQDLVILLKSMPKVD